MTSRSKFSRRGFLTMTAAAGVGLLAGCTRPEAIQGDSAIEILARQHGVLDRAVAILEEVRGGMDARMDLSPEIIVGTVEIVRLFIVEHHQKMEEQNIYPAFDAAKKMTAMVGVLREQHAAGAQLIEVLKELSVGFSAKDLEKRRAMGSAIHQFSRMYRAHADREDTVLFPVLRKLMSPKVYSEMSAGFQKAEKDFLGQNGFDDTIQKLTEFENALGIGDLASFTPRVDELR